MVWHSKHIPARVISPPALTLTAVGLEFVGKISGRVSVLARDNLSLREAYRRSVT